MTPIPAYIDPEAWDGFCTMRKTIKKPLTTRAAKMILVTLQRIKDAGHDANAALDQSTLHCWAAVYVPKAVEIERAPQSDAERTKREQQEDDARAISKPPDVLRALVQRLRAPA